MADRVGDAGSGLLLGHGKGEFRVGEGSARTHIRAGITGLLIDVHAGNDGAGGHFGAGSGQRRDGDDGQHLADGHLLADDVPRLAVVVHGRGDGLCAVNGGSAADGQQDVALFLAADAVALQDGLIARVRGDAAHLGIGDAGFLQAADDGVIRAVALDGTAAVDDQRLGAPLMDGIHQILEAGRAKIHTSRNIVPKVFHNVTPLKIF